MNINEIIESWDNEKQRYWGRVILESIEHQGDVPTLENILSVSAFALANMEREISTQSSVVLAQIDQITEELKKK